VGLRELEPQTLDALPIEPNISNVNDLRLALRGVADVIGNGTGKLGLLLPDGSVRVVILTFDALPDDAEEAETLLRWRMKENLSYPLEEAKLSYQILWKDPGSVGVMAVAAKASLLAEYEGALGLKDGGPELILPATLALLPLLGGALNATVSNRVSKLFGGGSVKIDPAFVGTLGNSTARITVQQQISRQVAVTFATKPQLAATLVEHLQ